MPSAWNTSWSTSWGDSWGQLITVAQAKTYHLKLGELGFTGTLPERQKKYLHSLGYVGAINDCMREHLRTLGYTQGVQQMLEQKARNENFSSISKMWIIQGLIPLE